MTSTLTVQTAGASAALRKQGSSRLAYAMIMPFLAVVLAGPFRRRGSYLAGVLAIVVLTAGLISCSSSNSVNTGGNPGTPAGTSTVTVTASTGGLGAISQSATLTINITQ